MERLQSLFLRYQNELRPLIIDFESREEEFLGPLLYGVPVMFDKVARFAQENDRRLLDEAEGSLNGLLSEVRSELLASYINSDNEFRRRYGDEVINAINGGSFSREYNRLRNEAKKAIGDGNMGKAIELFREIEHLREEHGPSALAVGNLRQGAVGFFIELIVSIIISVAAGLLIAKVI